MFEKCWPFERGSIYVDPHTHTPFDRYKLGCDPEFDATCHTHVCMACAAAHGLPGMMQDVAEETHTCGVSGCNQPGDIIYYFNPASVLIEDYYQTMMNA